MTDRMTNDERAAIDALREAFPMNAGLSAEKTWELREQLRPATVVSDRRRRLGVAVGVSIAASLAVAAGTFALYVSLPDRLADRLLDRVPEPTIADRYEAVHPDDQPYATPTAPSAVPAMALRAINQSGQVLHFTSVAQSEFGPDAGESTEEMWFDPKSGAGRLIRVNGSGKAAITTIVVSDGSIASVTTQRPGKPDVTESAELKGRLGKSFDKLSTYRKMLESGMATVTATGERDGEKTYTLTSTVDFLGDGELMMVIEAEVRADDYLPISCKSGFVESSGKVRTLKTRDFSEFETVDVDGLPADWFKPTRGASGTRILDI